MFDSEFLTGESGGGGSNQEDTSNKGTKDDNGKGKQAPLYVRDFFNVGRHRPWILVPNGSYKGFFDWVPREQRVGPWSFGALPFLLVVSSGLVYTAPINILKQSQFCQSDNVGIITGYPEAFSFYWYYNAIATVWMAFVLGRNIRQEGWVVPYTTFTVWSWTMLLFRHGISSLLPFLNTGGSGIALFKSCLIVNEMLRCPSLLNAFVVAVVWNVILAPGIYFFHMKTADQRSKFLKWLMQFNLINQHGLNLPLAVTSCLFVPTSSSRPRPLT